MECLVGNLGTHAVYEHLFVLGLEEVFLADDLERTAAEVIFLISHV